VRSAYDDSFEQNRTGKSRSERSNGLSTATATGAAVAYQPVFHSTLARTLPAINTVATGIVATTSVTTTTATTTTTTTATDIAGCKQEVYCDLPKAKSYLPAWVTGRYPPQSNTCNLLRSARDIPDNVVLRSARTDSIDQSQEEKEERKNSYT